MDKFHIYQPVAKGKPKVDKIEIFMSFFTPGKENAIKRKKLVMLCVDAGLIQYSEKWDNMDRAMRKLLERAKIDYSITNDGDGKGYYIPTKEEAVRLARNNKRERTSELFQHSEAARLIRLLWRTTSTDAWKRW